MTSRDHRSAHISRPGNGTGRGRRRSSNSNMILRLTLKKPDSSIRLDLSVDRPATSTNGILLLKDDLLQTTHDLDENNLLQHIGLKNNILLLRLLTLNDAHLANTPLLTVLINRSCPFKQNLMRSYGPTFPGKEPILDLTNRMKLRPAAGNFKSHHSAVKTANLWKKFPA